MTNTQKELTPNGTAADETAKNETTEDVVAKLQKELEESKQKFSASSREAQALHADLQETRGKLDKYEGSEAVEDIIRDEFPDFNDLTPSMQKIARLNIENNFKSKRREAVEREKQILAEKQRAKEDTFAKLTAKHPELATQKDKFIEFVDRHEAPLDIVASAFVGENVSTKQDVANYGQGSVPTPPDTYNLNKTEGEKLKDFFNANPVPSQKR